MNTDADDFARSPARKHKWRPIAIIVVVALLVAGGAYWLAHSTTPKPTGRFGRGSAAGAGGAAGGPAMPVGAAKAVTGDINI